jgi:hypothetical protein
MSKSKNGFGIAWPPNLHIGSIFFIRGYLNILEYGTIKPSLAGGETEMAWRQEPHLHH